MNLKKIGTVFTSKSVGTGPSSYEKRIYRAAVSQRLRNTGLHHIPRSSGKLRRVLFPLQGEHCQDEIWASKSAWRPLLFHPK